MEKSNDKNLLLLGVPVAKTGKTHPTSDNQTIIPPHFPLYRLPLSTKKHLISSKNRTFAHQKL